MVLQSKTRHGDREADEKRLTNGGETINIEKNGTLIGWAKEYVKADNEFTGQIIVEINFKTGEVQDLFVNVRRREIVKLSYNL